MSNQYTTKYTGQIKSKGWQVSEFLLYIGRSYDWYHRQCKLGEEKSILRLTLMIKGLDEK
jgi:hypothetical protein